jgi:hypothetical protein
MKLEKNVMKTAKTTNDQRWPPRWKNAREVQDHQLCTNMTATESDCKFLLNLLAI